jgi:hypothetical protein
MEHPAIEQRAAGRRAMSGVVRFRRTWQGSEPTNDGGHESGSGSRQAFYG